MDFLPQPFDRTGAEPLAALLPILQRAVNQLPPSVDIREDVEAALRLLAFYGQANEENEATIGVLCNWLNERLAFYSDSRVPANSSSV